MTVTMGVTANEAAVVGVGDPAVVRPQDLDPAPNPDPVPNPVPDPPQKGNPEVVPGKEFCTSFFCQYFISVRSADIYTGLKIKIRNSISFSLTSF